MASYAIKHLLLVSVVLTISFFFSYSRAATFDITNNCPYTVWAAAAGGGLTGGQQLDQGQSWQIDAAPGIAGARIWGRTGCNFDGNGNGYCQTGDCNGLLQCQGYGAAPNTLAEFALNQFNNLDFVDISLVAGFNIPMTFEGIGCRDITCNADVIGSCPGPLQTPGGCNNPCTVYPINEYCCTDGPGTCGPTDYSRYFKGLCPDAYSYPQDDATSVFTCPGGTNYNVIFCP